MDTDIEKAIVEQYPEYFPDFRGDPAKTCLAWGLAIGNGWSGLFRQLCQDIRTTNPPPEFQFEQVKEKFGGLRAYFYGGTPAIAALVEAAENASFQTCESCGLTGNVTTEGRWLKTLCADCRRDKQPLKGI